MMLRRLCREERGSGSVEFAIMGMLLCLVMFAVIEAGLLWWLKSGLRVTASMTARCGAIGYTVNASACPRDNPGAAKAYAVSMAEAFVSPGLISAADVTVNGVNGLVRTCNGLTGNFFSVTVQSGALASLPPPLGNLTVSGTACFPMP